MTQKFIPTIGETGYYRLSAPFTIPDGEMYTCKAIRQISELLEEGVDVYKDYYELQGIPEELYNSDVLEDIEIIYLMSSNNRWIYVPSRYLLGYPNMNGIPYRRVTLTITMPAFPIDQDFSNATDQLQQLVQMTLGVPCEIAPVETSRLVLVPSTDHETTQAERRAQMEVSTPISRATFWRNAYTDLKAKFDALVASMQ